MHAPHSGLKEVLVLRGLDMSRTNICRREGIDFFMQRRHSEVDQTQQYYWSRYHNETASSLPRIRPTLKSVQLTAARYSRRCLLQKQTTWMASEHVSVRHRNRIEGQLSFATNTLEPRSRPQCHLKSHLLLIGLLGGFPRQTLGGMTVVIMVVVVDVMALMPVIWHAGDSNGGACVIDAAVMGHHLCRCCRTCTEIRCSSPGTNEG